MGREILLGTYFYCEQCGRIMHLCNTCETCNIPMVKVPDYWIMERNAMFNDEEKKEFFENVIKPNPKFDQNKFEFTQEFLKNKDKTQNIPIVKCPYCNSVSVQKISNVKKIVKTGLFGLFGSGDLGKTYQCNSCKSRF